MSMSQVFNETPPRTLKSLLLPVFCPRTNDSSPISHLTPTSDEQGGGDIPILTLNDSLDLEAIITNSLRVPENGSLPRSAALITDMAETQPFQGCPSLNPQHLPLDANENENGWEKVLPVRKRRKNCKARTNISEKISHPVHVSSSSVVPPGSLISPIDPPPPSAKKSGPSLIFTPAFDDGAMIQSDPSLVSIPSDAVPCDSVPPCPVSSVPSMTSSSSVGKTFPQDVDDLAFPVTGESCNHPGAVPSSTSNDGKNWLGIESEKMKMKREGKKLDIDLGNLVCDVPKCKKEFSSKDEKILHSKDFKIHNYNVFKKFQIDFDNLKTCEICSECQFKNKMEKLEHYHSLHSLILSSYCLLCQDVALTSSIAKKKHAKRVHKMQLSEYHKKKNELEASITEIKLNQKGGANSKIFQELGFYMTDDQKCELCRKNLSKVSRDEQKSHFEACIGKKAFEKIKETEGEDREILRVVTHTQRGLHRLHRYQAKDVTIEFWSVDRYD